MRSVFAASIGTFIVLLSAASGCKLRGLARASDAGASSSPASTTSTTSAEATGATAKKGKHHGAPPRAAASGEAAAKGSVVSCWDDASEPTGCTEYVDLPLSVASVMKKECREDESVWKNGPCPHTGMIGVCKIPVDLDGRIFAYEAVYEGDSVASLTQQCKNEDGAFFRTWPSR